MGFYKYEALRGE